jgi:hypothetical protein
MAIISNNVAKWIDPNFSLLEVLVANSIWRSHLKNLWRILCESCPSSVLERGANKWLVRIFRGYKPNGANDYFNKTFHGAKKEAEKWLRGALAAVAAFVLAVYAYEISPKIVERVGQSLQCVQPRYQ